MVGTGLSADYSVLELYHWCHVERFWLKRSGSKLNPCWFALDSSRGMEAPELKSFMRLSVVFCDVVMYFPAVIGLIQLIQRSENSKQRYTLQTILVPLLSPALTIIDHGHFQ